MRPTARLLLLALPLLACRTAPEPSAGIEMPAPAAWTRDAAMYEINVRQFTPEGTFTALQRHLPRLDSLGVDILWLMPVQPIGVKNRKGGLGSYYSIANYTAVNPEFGTAADFRRFVDEAHALGMRVILDWVGNHTAFDHPWITQHPDWYTRRADGSISYPIDQQGKETDWTDVADLNFDKPDMRRAMIADMRWWIDSMNVDGFRCDVAWGIPYDFWAEARRELQAAKPSLFMLAEAEDPKLHQWFEATYAWEFHHLLNEITQGKKTVDAIDEYYARVETKYPDGAYRLMFTSNHDENSWSGSEFERMGPNHLPAFVLATTLERSMPLMYTGQEASLSKRLRFFEKDTVDWNGASLASFYRSMFELKESQEALWNGAYGAPQRRLTTRNGGGVYAFTRSEGSSTVLVAVNFGVAPAQVTYEGLDRSGTWTDWFTKSRVTLGSTGTLDIPAHGYRVFVR